MAIGCCAYSPLPGATFVVLVPFVILAPILPSVVAAPLALVAFSSGFLWIHWHSHALCQSHAIGNVWLRCLAFIWMAIEAHLLAVFTNHDCLVTFLAVLPSFADGSFAAGNVIVPFPAWESIGMRWARVLVSARWCSYKKVNCGTLACLIKPAWLNCRLGTRIFGMLPWLVFGCPIPFP